MVLLLVHISPPPPPVFVFGWSPVYLHPPYLNIGWTGEPASGFSFHKNLLLLVMAAFCEQLDKNPKP
jgi:hypothetical protein